MKLIELYDICKRHVETGRGSDTVVVETAHGGIPTRVMVGVESAHSGFDWTAGRFVVRTEAPLLPIKQIVNNPTAYAKQYLEHLQTAYSTLKFKLLPRAHERAWIDGFSTGIREHVTAVVQGLGYLRNSWRPKNVIEQAAMQRCLSELLAFSGPGCVPEHYKRREVEAFHAGREVVCDLVREMLTIVNADTFEGVDANTSIDP